ncbi:Uncharacterized protein APZ42_032920 [Daphnia magna]|uniref:Uncharacterized protein n=1 Tax=Daphnia magna TaxID=35525 RepID=A0A164LJM7_9CRUS|nr:Uncharacterized protein APZ42_032920 [Daphnia magna]
MQRGLRKAFAEVEGHSKRAQERYKAYHDSRRRETAWYAVREKVLIYKPVRKIRRAEKLLHRWYGPYVVGRQTTPLNDEVKLADGRARKTERVQVIRIKKFVEEAAIPKEAANREAGEETLALGEEQSEEGPKKEVASEKEEKYNNPSREEESGTRRYPKRSRMPPQRLMFSLSLFFMDLVFTPRLGITAVIVLSNGVIFRAEGERVFNDSEWKLVTDITFGQTDVVAAGLYIITRSYEGLKATVCAPRRPRRQHGVMDGGGTELNWLYGVTTTDVLVKVNKNIEQLSTESTAIVHALEVHTSLINESVWEIEASAQKNGVPTRKCAQGNEKSMVGDGEGLAGVAMERLALALFPPTQLGLVLTEVNGNLPTGLSLVSQFQMRDMWSAYQSARVVAAAVEGGIRLFIHFPSELLALPLRVLEIMSVQRTNMGTIEIRKGSEQGKDGDKSDLMEIVKRNGKVRGELDSLGKRIQHLVENDSRRVETIDEWRNPWEVYGLVALALVGLISGIHVLRNLEKAAGRVGGDIIGTRTYNL